MGGRMISKALLVTSQKSYKFRVISKIAYFIGSSTTVSGIKILYVIVISVIFMLGLSSFSRCLGAYCPR